MPLLFVVLGHVPHAGAQLLLAAVLQLGDIGIQLNGAAAFRLGAAACDFRLNGAAGTVRRDTAVTARGAADV